MKPTLLILAAGMGSRYGGLKQLDGVGPNGETILDYSVYDAVEAGFGKVVFVIRKHFREEFENSVVRKYSGHIDVELVEQELDKLPQGYSLNPDREKPWGTAHAMMMASECIDTPFAVINADDFYGKESFKVLGNFLKDNNGAIGKYCMVGFNLDKTLSESGGVSRGICSVDSDNYLTNVVEHHKIADSNSVITGISSEDNKEKILSGDAYTSMNMWGFTPDIFKHSEDLFKAFLDEKGNELKSEFYIPFVVNDSIEKGIASVKVLSTHDKWFGVTYKEDRPIVVEKLLQMEKEGIYKRGLF